MIPSGHGHLSSIHCWEIRITQHQIHDMFRHLVTEIQDPVWAPKSRIHSIHTCNFHWANQLFFNCHWFLYTMSMEVWALIDSHTQTRHKPGDVVLNSVLWECNLGLYVGHRKLDTSCCVASAFRISLVCEGLSLFAWMIDPTLTQKCGTKKERKSILLSVLFDWF